MSDALPFDGLKVADFSWIGVGPITAKALGDHGATVVRVESESSIDRLRVVGPFKDGVAGIDRSQFFADFNSSKLGVTLDLKNPAGREIAYRLIAWSDLYIESFTAGTMDELGIGYDTARSLNPGIIMVSTCLMGQTGPAAAFAGYGYHAGAVAGFYEVTGWPDLPPDGPWMAYTDTVAPRFLTATVMAALDHRRRTGEGQYIDAAQIEMALHFLAPQIIDFSVSGRLATRNGNRSDSAAPHAVYPCKGEDQWCAIAVESEAQWKALRQAMGGPAWSENSKFQAAGGRLENQDELDRDMSSWTKTMTPQEVLQRLQSVGVPSGVVQRSSDLLQDPQLAHRGFHRYLEHGEMGVVPYAGHQFRIAGYDNGPRWASPTLGQHNEAVLREVLGMSEDDITEAVVSGAVS